MEKEKLISYKDQLIEYIMKTFFADEKQFFTYLESKSFLTVLLEISSLSHRYLQSKDDKLKKLLVKQLIIMLFQIEIIVRYSDMLKLLGIDYNQINLEEPTIYTPYKVSDDEIKVIDTIGKMCCNFSLGIWNNFTDNNYSPIHIIQQFQQLKDEKSFGLFVLELELYVVSLIVAQDINYINDILPNAFIIRNKQEKINNAISKLLKNKTATQKSKVTVVEQPIIEFEGEKFTEQEIQEMAKELHEGVKENGEVYKQFLNKLENENKKESNEELIAEIVEEPDKNEVDKQDEEEITLKESHINENGELEESKIKTIVIHTEE